MRPDFCNRSLSNPFKHWNEGTNLRTCLKKRILVQGVGGAGFQTAGILKYVEDLKAGTNENCDRALNRYGLQPFSNAISFF